MNDINQTILIGRLTKDLDDQNFAYTTGGIARANISIAVNRAKKQGDQWVDEVSYFDITLWGKTAENLKPYLVKGKQIGVTAHLRQDRWEKDGQKFSRITVVADDVQLLGGAGTSSGGYAQQGGSYGPPQQSYTSKPQNYVPAGNADDFPEDIPF